MPLSIKNCHTVFLLIVLTPAVCSLSQQEHSQTSGYDRGVGKSNSGQKADVEPKTLSTVGENPQHKFVSQVVSDPPELKVFLDHVTTLVLSENFAELDRMADTERASKSRFTGGGWKLSRLYDAAKDAGGHETEADWQNHIDLLQRWIAARPQSITARVALADTYVGYAWAARGSGYGDTVTDQGWQLFKERTNLADKVLTDAAKLSSKCPHWYEVMQQTALAEGADISRQRDIFENAIKFEPLYFAYYQRFAIALLPKWEGEPGDTGKFAEETYRRIGGKNGAYMYFEIGSNLCGACGDFSADQFSWQKLQEGFAALEELYGVTQLKLNRFAFLASTYGDRAVAAKTFQRIGPNWDPSIWGSRARFESQRNWAGLSTALPIIPATAAHPNPSVPPSSLVEQMLMLANKERNENHWAASTDLASRAIQAATSLPGNGSQLGRAYLIIANNDYSQGDVPKAQAMLDKSLSVLSDKAGANSIELAAALVQAALSAQMMSDYASAEKNLRRAIEIRNDVNGPSDPELSNNMTILGNFLQMRGRNREAIELYQRAISTRESANPDDLALISPLEQLGVMYEAAGRYDDAEKAFTRFLHLMEGHFGLTSSNLMDPLSKLAGLYHASGKVEDEARTKDRLQAIQTRAAK